MLSIRETREAWHMAAAKLSDEGFSAILEAHPGLRERFASIAMAVANSGENLKEADAIEERIVEEMRLLGREAMQGWAETQVKAPNFVCQRSFFYLGDASKVVDEFLSRSRTRFVSLRYCGSKT